MFLPMEKGECFSCLGSSVHTYTMRRSLERLHCLLEWIEVLLLLLFCYYTNRVLQWPSKAVGGEGGFTFVPSFKFLCSDQTHLTQCYVGILCEPLYIWLCIYTIIVNVNAVSFLFPIFTFEYNGNTFLLSLRINCSHPPVCVMQAVSVPALN